MVFGAFTISFLSDSNHLLNSDRLNCQSDCGARLLLQKQITLDDEPEQLLHAVVVGSQFDALLLQEHKFVVGQAAANSITGGTVPGVRWLDTALHSIGIATLVIRNTAATNIA